jgi:hypothetical protein
LNQDLKIRTEIAKTVRDKETPGRRKKGQSNTEEYLEADAERMEKTRKKAVARYMLFSSKIQQGWPLL